MNLTGNKIELQRVPAYVTESESRSAFWFYVLVVVSFFIHAFVAYTHRPFASGAGLEILFGVFNFGAIVFLYYGISRLYFTRQLIVLSLSAIFAITMSLAYLGKVTPVMITAGWCAVIITPLVCSQLARKNYSPLRIYLFSLITLVLFSSVQLYPLWTKIISSADEAVKLLSSEITEMLTGAGYTQTAINETIDQFKMLYLTVTRVMPGISLMAVMMQFSIGFYLFMRWLNRSGNSQYQIESFLKWKMPFVVTPLLILSIILRLSGNESLTLVADNLILILAVYYSITGISLMEFFIKKFYVSTLGRILIYLLLFLSHIIGFALLAVLGFVDSFYDWRRKYPLPLDVKTS